jgi:hypothetical protein
MTTRPQLSVILATDRYETIRRVVERLREQTVREQVEVVIVCPSLASLDADSTQLQGFAAVQTLEVESLATLAAARAAGVRAAAAPVVFLGETHSFPQPGWAEALIAAHRGEWVAVVPGIGNANPENAISWASLLTDYGPWIEGLPRRETNRLPTWNTAYKRQALVAFGDALDGLLSYGDDLQIKLRADGHRFLFVPEAKLDHANIARPRAWLRERFLGGRVVSAGRMSEWSALRRLVYVAGSPLIPFVTLRRSLGAVQAARKVAPLPMATYGLMIVGTAVSALGELIGYAAGPSPTAEAEMTELEVHKLPHTSLSSQ